MGLRIEIAPAGKRMRHADLCISGRTLEIGVALICRRATENGAIFEERRGHGLCHVASVDSEPFFVQSGQL